MKKPDWFKLTENDQPISIKPKNHRFLSLLIGVLIGVVGSYLLIPQKVAVAPIEQVTKPISNPTIKPPVIKAPIASPAIKNPMLNPSGDEDQDDFEEDEDDD